MIETEKMPVVILCGGMGTRLKEEMEYKPKPTIEIGNKPILWHIMKIYAHMVLKTLYLRLGYKGKMMRCCTTGVKILAYYQLPIGISIVGCLKYERDKLLYIIFVQGLEEADLAEIKETRNITKKLMEDRR